MELSQYPLERGIVESVSRRNVLPEWYVRDVWLYFVFFHSLLCLRYGDSVGNITKENSSIFSLI